MHSHGQYGHGVPRVLTDKPTRKPISAAPHHNHIYRDDEHNNQIKLDNLGVKQVLDNTRRGGDGQSKASRATDNMTIGGGGDNARRAGGGGREGSEARQFISGGHNKMTLVEDL